MIARRVRSSRADAGQTLVEFALILPIFILVLMGIFDLGRAVYAFNTITNASREGVRLAITDQNVNNIKVEAAQHSVSLGVLPSNVNVEFRTSDLSSTCAPVSIGCVAVVTVNYRYTAATPVIGNIVGTINMQAVTRQAVENPYASP